MRRQAIWVVLMLVSACGEGRVSVAQTPDNSLRIERVEVQVVRTTRPPQVVVRVQGMLLDGCTSLGPVSQRRDGRTVTVTIATKHTGAKVCTQVAQLLDETIRLEGTFSAGEYVVRVNGVGRRFSV
jgi:inhibitor of cysteine peptidase